MKPSVLRLALLGGVVSALGLGYKLRSNAYGVPIDIERIMKQAHAARPVVTSQNAFGVRLLQRKLAQHPQDNVLVSPLSIWQCAAMAQLGARGTTKSGLRGALSIPASTQDAPLNAANAALLANLKAQNGVTLNVANALWASQKFTIVPTFARDCQTHYGADATTLDFAAPSAAERINDWVSTRTQGKINEIVSPQELDATTPLCLTNAMYFHGLWQTAFDASETKDATFHCADGSTKTLPFMRLDDLEGAYCFGTTFDAVCLPYKNSTCVLWALLPRKGKSLLSVLKEFDATQLRNRDKVNVQLPRFKMESSVELSEDFKALGATQAFERSADFSTMIHAPVYISALRHKALIEVDEEGTTAVAATTIEFGAGGSASATPTVVFDHPFVVALVEQQSGATLMLGVVNAPEQLSR